MRVKLAGGLDLATGTLILGGVALIAAALVAGAILLSPPPPGSPIPTAVDAPPANNKPSRAALVLPLDKVAAVLQVEATTSAGAAARAGDRIDVLGYFSRQVTGQDNVTRVLLQEVSVLAVDRSGPNVSLTLAVPQQEALLLQEAQALGARAFVALRPAQAAGDTLPRTTFSDTDLASRLAGASTLR